MQALSPHVEPKPPSEAILAPTVPPDSMTLMPRSNGSCAAEAEAVLTRWSVTLGVTGILLIGVVEHFISVCCDTAGSVRRAAAVRPAPVGPPRPPRQTRELRMAEELGTDTESEKGDGTAIRRQAAAGCACGWFFAAWSSTRVKCSARPSPSASWARRPPKRCQ